MFFGYLQAKLTCTVTTHYMIPVIDIQIVIQNFLARRSNILSMWIQFSTINCTRTKYVKHSHELDFEPPLHLYSVLVQNIVWQCFHSQYHALFCDLQRCFGIKNVYMKACLLEMTEHAELFAQYCHGSDHAVVMCGRRNTGGQLPKELSL